MDWWKTRKRLIAERDYAWDMLDKLRSMIAAELDVSAIKVMMEKGMDKDPPRFLPGSDIGEGILMIQHWATAALAYSFKDTLAQFEGAKNYVSVMFSDNEGHQIEVVIRKAEGLTPAQKAAKLEKELEELKREKNELPRPGQEI